MKTSTKLTIAVLFLGILYNTYMKDYEDALLLALVILLILQILYYEKWKKNKIK